MNKGTETIEHAGTEYTCDWQTTCSTFDCEIYLNGVCVTDDISQDTYDAVTQKCYDEIKGNETYKCTATDRTDED